MATDLSSIVGAIIVNNQHLKFALMKIDSIEAFNTKLQKVSPVVCTNGNGSFVGEWHKRSIPAIEN